MNPTLGELLNSNLEWIFVGGKGGAGKTTTSCALATLFATSTMADAAAAGGTRRRRVLLISTDPAHNLSDVFGQHFSSQPTPVKGLEATLSAMEINPAKFLHGSLLGLLTADGVDAEFASPTSSCTEAEREELISKQSLLARLGGVLKEAARNIPGIDELSVFEEVIHFVNHLTFDVLIFDTAPTGHMLRMLAVPQMLNSVYEKLLSLEGLEPFIEALTHVFPGDYDDRRRGSGRRSGCSSSANSSHNNDISSIGPVASPHPDSSSRSSTWSSAVMDGPIDRESFRATVRKWRAFMQEVQARFCDPERTSFVCVCVAEFLSVYETERLVQELMKWNINCDSVVVNQLLLKPANEPPCRMCAARQKIQKKYLDQIDLLYEDFHVVRMPLLSDEVRGLAALQIYARFLLEPYDPEKHGYVDIDSVC